MRLFGLLTGLALTAAETTWDPIPSVDGVAITKHFLAREAMLKLEESQRQDHEFRQRLSPIAIKADAIVREIRSDELQHFWRQTNSSDDTFAGSMFPLARPFITKTKLWTIVRRLPKGALLHSHLSAMLPYGVLLEAIFHTPGMAVSASQSLNSEEARRNASIAFSHVNTTFASGTPITADEYVAGTPVFVRAAASSFPGGKEGFIEYSMSKLVISPEQATRHDLGVDEIWRRFESLFGTAGTLLTYEPIVRTFYRQLFSRLVDDGVSWVEIRAGGSEGKLVHAGEQDADPDLDAWWELMQDEMERFKASERGGGFLGARVI
ncbi:adenosine deaminase family protein [Ophiocordyceps camponoti-floridani]|uniref:Adenosine deaminase family protein n=1 Tax=Ophiocordyceps camponoti-floridani TaxID=2030778 RepID=A0A8H4Q9V7_9HYPO|nr:adenosine deaminase family protein [Ophiocordyceps camponoti-floridani]